MQMESDLQPISEFEHFLNQLDEDRLRLLNRMVVERLKLCHKVRNLKQLAKFNLMDKVCFKHNDQYIVGIVTKLNQRSVTLRTPDNHRWNVDPSFLTRLL